MTKCGNCGYPLEGSEKFCPQCATPAAQQPEAAPKHGVRAITAIMLAVVGISVMASVVLERDVVPPSVVPPEKDSPVQHHEGPAASVQSVATFKGRFSVGDAADDVYDRLRGESLINESITKQSDGTLQVIKRWEITTNTIRFQFGARPHGPYRLSAIWVTNK